MLAYVNYLVSEFWFNYEEFADFIDKDEPESGLVDRYRELIDSLCSYIDYLERAVPSLVQPVNLV